MNAKTASPLDELIALERDARLFGFDWNNQGQIIDQALSECQEIREAIAHKETPERIQEEIGDLLHTAISLCLFSGFDIQETLSLIVKKFGKRMTALKRATNERGLNNLQGQSTSLQLELWEKVKKN